jgi:hypothetical protein
VLSIIAASKILGIGKNQAYAMVKQGLYPVRVLNISGRFKISKFDLLAYLDAPGYERPALPDELAS